MSKERLSKYVRNLDGYKISETHFKIGSKIHSSDFYYAKRLFQNSYYTSRLALLLAIKIKNEFEDTKCKITLVGYEMYSELLLSLVKKFLKDFGYKNINHCTTQDVDGEMKYLPNDIEIKEKIAIIVPITSTGSTSSKIKNNLKLKKSDLVDNNITSLTVLQAYDDSEDFKDDVVNTANSLITLKTKWFKPKKCIKCFDNTESKPLFETDKSSLTPTLIFNQPSKAKEEDKSQLGEKFDNVKFQNSLIYRKAKRNNEHFLYSTNTDILIEENEPKIKVWLKKLKEALAIKPNDKITIISPSHYSNSLLINLVNELVFNSSATIIHHQTDVDFLDNFKLLNQSFLSQEDTKVFFVDDSLITGGTFFKLYDLFRYSNNYKKALDGAIFLSNKASADINTRVSRTVEKKDTDGNIIAKNLYAFVNINLPSHPKISDKKPLEHETSRYNDLIKYAIHDVIKDRFQFKVNKLIGKDKNEHSEKNPERHLKMFTATHKVYEYFRDNSNNRDIQSDDLIKGCGFVANNIEDKMALLKVLSQYPFFLYKPLRKLTFQWHKNWLNEALNRQTASLIDNKYSYNEFIELKFLIRRAVFVGNYHITSKDFFNLISDVLNYSIISIKHKATINENFTQPSLFDTDVKETINIETDLVEAQKLNIESFHLYLIENYVELFHKNGWAANRTLESIKEIETQFSSPQAKQFVRMLKIEAAIVLTDFYGLINDKENWRKLYLNEDNNKESPSEESILEKEKQIPKLNSNSEAIEAFFEDNKDVLETNKFQLSDDVLKLKHTDSLKQQVVNFLWIKQFLNTDQNRKIKEIAATLNEKTEAIFEKLKQLFDENLSNMLGSFFIVNDGKKQAHLVYDVNKDGHSFLNELDTDKHKLLFQFMQGEKVATSRNNSKDKLIPKSIVEYQFINDENKWVDLYALKDSNATEKLYIDTKNLLLIRISDKDFRTLGLIGFYGSEELHKDLLAKQLLMLLRSDLANFITTHHQNDEFAALRQAEAIKRFAYLAGHGRYMMQELAKDNDLFEPVVKTMEKLQYLFATKFIPQYENSMKDKRDLENEIFAIYKNGNTEKSDLKTIVEMGNAIFETKVVENKVELEYENNLLNVSDDFSFKFNGEILKFICFELLINAKKNRFHFIDKSCDCKIDINKIDIKFEKKQEQELIVKLTGTGVEISETLSSKIKIGTHIKKDTEIAGLYLVFKVIKLLNAKNKIEIDMQETPICGNCGIYNNVVTLTLKSSNGN